ncbi:forkhead box protein N2-like [Ischnura elegans]|uniref:forkhead box protein N2-like n=1 Tax=Ischnura elegans TaxID=197161 RepID=UPI001ED8B0AD|nr:forkhead box protein N2-like [Ischnura elegans]
MCRLITVAYFRRKEELMAPERPNAEDGSGVAPTVPCPTGPPRNSTRSELNGMAAPPRAKEGDGATDSFPDARTLVETTYEDNDLTSLTWLQDRNLLKGMNLQSGDSLSPEAHSSNDESVATTEGADDIRDAISPTSDYADSTSSSGHRSPGLPDDTTSLKSLRRQPVLLSPSVAGASSLPVMTRLKFQHSSYQSQTAGNQRPYDPQVHVGSKPPFSFSCLIFMAIEDSPKKALPVKEIYAWILEHFPYFKDAPTGWKNSVRHNLSLNKCFKKVEKAPNLGKGSLWMVDDIFRPNLLQALSKAPCQPTHLQRNSSSNGLTVTSPQREDYVVLSGIRSNCNVPDPELFPLLSRRLAAAVSAKEPVDVPARRRHKGGEGACHGDSLDDAAAATAMLALKHGPHVLFSSRDRKPQGEVDNSKQYSKGCSSNKAVDKTSNTSQLFPVITSFPSEDHTYSAGRQAPGVERPRWSVGAVVSSVSPDEAFSEASDDGDDDSMMQPAGMAECDLEEQRKIAEGADALLNLAGIRTEGLQRRRRAQQHVPVDLSAKVRREGASVVPSGGSESIVRSGRVVGLKRKQRGRARGELRAKRR